MEPEWVVEENSLPKVHLHVLSSWCIIQGLHGWLSAQAFRARAIRQTDSAACCPTALGTASKWTARCATERAWGGRDGGLKQHTCFSEKP